MTDPRSTKPGTSGPERPGGSEPTVQTPWQIIGVAPGASEAQVREAYVELVRVHSPESDPEGYERLRKAFAELRDPIRRAVLELEAIEPVRPLSEVLKKNPPVRKFVGPAPWLAVLKGE